MNRYLLACSCALAALASAPAMAQQAQERPGEPSNPAQVPTDAATPPQPGSGGTDGQQNATGVAADAASVASGGASIPSPEAGDIIVTATRTETLLSKTPVSLTAITGDGLRAAGITNPTGLTNNVPNLQIDRANGGLIVTVRGVASNDTSEKGDPSAAFLLDGVYIARPQAQEVSFFDISRVEVLRGPQGTLYGRNTTSGAINVITNRPSFDWGGSIDASYGAFNAVQGTAVVNAPVSDSIAIRASVNYERRDNYVIGGPRVTGSIDPFRDTLSGRLQGLLRWGSGDLLLRGDYSKIKGTTTDYLPLASFYRATTTGVDPVYLGGSGKRLRRLNAGIGFDTGRDNDTWGVGAELTQEIGPFAFTYVGSYREFDRDEVEARISTDGLSAYRLDFVGHYNQNSQELRLATTGNGPLKVQAGGYYFREKAAVDLRVLLTPNPSAATVTGSTAAFFQDPVIAESYAGFGQATYSLTDRLRVTGGARYSHDLKSRVGASATCSNLTCSPLPTLNRNDARGTFDKITWRGGIDFDVTSAILLYGVASTGYKAGGFNDGCLVGTATGCNRSLDALYYNPETLQAYEVGAKLRALDNAVRLNMAAFKYSYDNIQISQVVNDCGNGAACNVTTNGGKASVAGFEAEGTVTPTINDRFDFSVAYLDAHYTDYRPSATVNYSGRPLDRAPSWTVTAGYQHTIPLANDGNIELGARTRMSDGYSFIILGTSNFYRQPSYTKTDATITYNAPGKRYYLQGFVRNIEDTLAVSTVVVGTRSSVQISDPRTYGVRAGIRF